MKRRPLGTRGFSLLELLVVMAVLGVVAALTLPSLQGLLGGQRLSTTATALTAELGEAQQLAQTLNRTVELRFYRCVNPQEPGSVEAYRLRQLLVREASGAVFPQRAAESFETGTILATDPRFTTLLKDGESTPGANDLRLPAVGTAYHFFGVLFQPGGGIRLAKGSSDRWCLTVVNERDYRQPEVLPANFATLQLDPYNGSVRLLQP